MAEHEFPASVDGLTADWLTDALTAAGALDGGRVTGFSSEPIGQGIGLLGLLHRITPIYETG